MDTYIIPSLHDTNLIHKMFLIRHIQDGMVDDLLLMIRSKLTEYLIYSLYEVIVIVEDFNELDMIDRFLKELKSGSVRLDVTSICDPNNLCHNCKKFITGELYSCHHSNTVHNICTKTINSTASLAWCNCDMLDKRFPWYSLTLNNPKKILLVINPNSNFIDFEADKAQIQKSKNFKKLYVDEGFDSMDKIKSLMINKKYINLYDFCLLFNDPIKHCARDFSRNVFVTTDQSNRTICIQIDTCY